MHALLLIIDIASQAVVKIISIGETGNRILKRLFLQSVDERKLIFKNGLEVKCHPIHGPDDAAKLTSFRQGLQNNKFFIENIIGLLLNPGKWHEQPFERNIGQQTDRQCNSSKPD